MLTASLRAILVVAAIFLSACAGTPREEPAAAPIDKPTVLITGSSRGIGYELARQYAERGWGVIATARDPATAEGLKALAAKHPKVRIERLDVTDFSQIDALANRYRGVPIDLLINNAGILGDNDKQKFGTFDYAAFDLVMATNTRGPTRMLEAFVDHVAASDQKKIMNISSLVGSIGMTFGGQTFYRASKSALNMTMANLAKELRRMPQPGRKDIIIGLINPGIVETGFSKKLPIPMIQADVSAAAVITVIDGYTLDMTGTFMDYTGKKLPW